MKKHFVKGIILLFLLVIQSSILNTLRPGALFPDLFLLGLISISLTGGFVDGAFYGVIGGFLQDLIYSNIIGINALSKFITGSLVGYLSIFLFKKNILIPLTINITGSLVHYTVYMLIILLLNIETDLLGSIPSKILMISVINALFGIFIFKLFLKIDKWERLS